MGRYTMLIVALSCCLPGPLVMAAFQGPPMAAAQSLPGDRDRTQTAVITSTSEQYTVVMESAVDGVMTRDPIGYAAYDQGWQPNRFARLENVGDTDIVNPWLTVNGRRRWRSVDEMAAQAIGGYTTDRDKARAVWEFSRHHRFHACTWCNECNDAVKVFNVYGYTLCGNDAQILSDLWKAAGLTVRRGYPVGHCVAEVFYDGECHLLDGDEHCIYLRRDNRTIASEAEVVRDHDLIKRTHTYGILSADNPLRDQFSASLFGYEGERKGKWGGRSKHTMAYTLRPGESIEWRWDHIGKQYTAGTVPKKGEKRRDGHGDLQAWGSRAYANLRNGRLRYAPDFSSPIARQGIADSANLHPEGIVLRPRATGMPCHVTWRIANAYVVVGGTVAIRGSKAAEEDVFEISLSADGKQWERLWSAAATTGNINKDIRFDDRLSPGRKPQYAYFVRLTLQSNEDTGVSLSRVVFDTDVQMSALALPELEAGKNTINYEDESPGPRRVRVTHGWVERAAWRPPGVPAPTEPADAAIVLGTRVRLAWHPPTDPDGDSIMDYHVQVAEHDDMRWVLSPNFDKLVSKTPSKGKAEWTVPATGLLNPGTPYYWRVRARDACGVWGVWSEPQRFTCDSPGVPLDVKAQVDVGRGVVVLTWRPNPQGAPPVAYRVYASDEQGFSISDAPYKLKMGRGFCRDVDEYEAKGKVPDTIKAAPNFLAETPNREQTVVGPALTGPNANKAYYRVIAIDARGLRSGSSDHAETPRPFIYTTPALRAQVGQPYVYEPKSLFSIGDLRCKGGYKAAFWDREKLAFALTDAPVWLTINADTGRIHGVPPPGSAGTHRLIVRVTNSRGGTAEQNYAVRASEQE